MTADPPSNSVANSRTTRLLRLLFGVQRPRELARLLPGSLLAVGVMLAALPLADLAGRAILSAQGLDPAGKSSPVSGVLIAILLGALLRNVLPLPAVTQAGVAFCVARVLRLGIILVGIKLSLFDIARLGAWGLPIVGGTILAGLVLIGGLSRLLNLPPALGTLLAAGTSICGLTAVVSTAAAIRAPQREVAYAVANITLFGLLGMLVYPHVAPLVLHTPEQVGLFLGTAIHDTSQVVGAALTYKELHADDATFKAATVTKLTRNLFLAAVVPLMALLHARQQARLAASGDLTAGQGSAEAPPDSKPRSAASFFPLFILGFIAMALVRTAGDAMLQTGRPALGLWGAEDWKRVTNFIAETLGSRYVLGTALAAVGLSTSFGVFRAVGLRPLIVGMLGAVLVGLTGLGLSLWLGQYVRLG